MMKAITRIVIQRLRKKETSVKVVLPRIIAIIPVHPDVQLNEFVTRLAKSLSAVNSTLHLSSEGLDTLGSLWPGAAQTTKDPNQLRIGAWLDEQENRHCYIIYESDMQTSSWTERCLRRADHILLVANAGNDSALGDIEQTYLRKDRKITNAHQTLILLHPDGSRSPFKTRQWLSVRDLDMHHHIRLDRHGDFGRLARFLSGQAIGLVLGGGGARCCAQIGVIRALTEADIPIDMIGGTSGGGAIAAKYAMGKDNKTIIAEFKKHTVDENPFKDYTLPIISLISNKKFDQSVKTIYKDICIEDLWINYFCVSCNLSTTETVIYQSGPLWKAVRATASLPGILVPFIEDNHLLIDGGVVDNLPIKIMKEKCKGPVIPVNVSPDKEFITEYSYEDIPSPWQILRSRANPLTEPIKFPSIIAVIMRTLVVNSYNKIRTAQAEEDFLLDPPIDRFGLLEFSAIDEMVEIGYQYTKDKIKEWQKKESFKKMNASVREEQ